MKITLKYNTEGTFLNEMKFLDDQLQIASINHLCSPVDHQDGRWSKTCCAGKH